MLLNCNYAKIKRLLIFKDLKTCLVFLYTNVYRTSHLFFISTVIQTQLPIHFSRYYDNKYMNIKISTAAVSFLVQPDHIMQCCQLILVD